ncbi:unnamed protein product [Symbiodinium natans]|uniref:Uncharacterized protein n=1 Tax=Symbiodinium natans TaxID=878477 RepID=A0A812I9H0_9DINO|nr:unnamed protein product [Symbiodinium natans]
MSHAEKLEELNRRRIAEGKRPPPRQGISKRVGLTSARGGRPKQRPLQHLSTSLLRKEVGRPMSPGTWGRAALVPTGTGGRIRPYTKEAAGTKTPPLPGLEQGTTAAPSQGEVLTHSPSSEVQGEDKPPGSSVQQARADDSQQPPSSEVKKEVKKEAPKASFQNNQAAPEEEEEEVKVETSPTDSKEIVEMEPTSEEEKGGSPKPSYSYESSSSDTELRRSHDVPNTSWKAILGDEVLEINCERKARSKTGATGWRNAPTTSGALSTQRFSPSIWGMEGPGWSSPRHIHQILSANSSPGASHHGHGREVELSSFYQGIFPSHSRNVGRGLVKIAGWGEVHVSITEFERLLPPPSIPTEEEVLHMAWILGTAALYGFTVRAANPKNWGLRPCKSPSDAPEFVMCDVAGWEPSDRGWTPDRACPQRIRVYGQLSATAKGRKVIAAMMRQECLSFTPVGEPAVAAQLKGTLQPSDWRLLTLPRVDGVRVLKEEGTANANDQGAN